MISAQATRTRVKRNWRTLAQWAPLPFAAAYAIALVVNFRDIAIAINRNGDAVIALMIGKLWGEAGSESTVELGNHAWYEELLLLRATSGAPFYRELWYVTPLLLCLAALVLLLWSIRRLYGTWAAVLAGSALLCIGHLGRFMFFSFNWHGFAAVHLVVMGVGLVWVVTRAKPWRLAPLIGFSLAMGLFSALAMASDPAFRYWSLVPLLGTAGLAAWRLRGAPRRSAIVYNGLVAGVSVLGGAVLIGIMEDQGVEATELTTSFATVDKLVPNLELLLQGFTALAGGAFFGAKPNFAGIATLVTGTLALAGIYFALRECRHWARSEALEAEGTPEAGRFVHPAGHRGAKRDGASARNGLGHALRGGGRVPPRTAPGGSRRALPGWPRNKRRSRLRRGNDINVGYADYWDGPALTWLGHFEVELYPVETCGPQLCRHPLVHISTWYDERPEERSMLVVDANQPGVQAPSEALGEPIATRSFGALTMYAYDHDLARGIQ